MTTKNTAPQALARARTFTRYGHNECLRFVSDAFSAGTLPYTWIADALEGWKATKARHYDRTPPEGVPGYWTGPNPHGHVAISAGGGIFRSTDWPSNGQVGEVHIDELEHAWGLTWLGWGADFCGDPIGGIVYPQPARPVVHLANLRPAMNGQPATRNEDVRTYSHLLWHAQGPIYQAAHARAWAAEPGDEFGPVTEQMTHDTYVALEAGSAHLPAGDPNRWPDPPARPCWPGPRLIRFIGGIPA